MRKSRYLIFYLSLIFIASVLIGIYNCAGDDSELEVESIK